MNPNDARARPKKRRIRRAIVIGAALAVTAAALPFACLDWNPPGPTAPSSSDALYGPIVALAPPTDTSATSRPEEPFYQRMFVVGWSMAMGFGTSRDLKTDVPLGLILEAMIQAPHDKVRWRTGGAFYDDPLAAGKEQLAAAWLAQPSALVAIDFPFWFLYGKAKTASQRLERLDRCLEWLEHFESIPVVIGTIPDLERGLRHLPVNLMLALDEATLGKANDRLEKWAASHANVVVVPLERMVDDVRKGRALTLGPNSWAASSRERVLQSDGLHPTIEGLCGIGAYALDLLAKRKGPVPDGALQCDARAWADLGRKVWARER